MAWLKEFFVRSLFVRQMSEEYIRAALARLCPDIEVDPRVVTMLANIDWDDVMLPREIYPKL